MTTAAPHPIYDVPLKLLDGTGTTLAPYRGKALLFVNVASHCGYTPQYTGLETLHRVHGPKGFEVLGFPCNQFGEQEAGTAEEIQQFCSLTYDVTFPIFEKIEVNGPNANPVWAHLKKERPGLLWTEAVKWNFTKFLVGRDGRVLKRFGPDDEPAAIEADIVRAVAVPPSDSGK